MIGGEDRRFSGPGRGTSRVAQRLTLHADRLFPADPGLRDIARRIFASARDLPILSPHGHTDPAWFATNSAWQDATSLLLVPDHYLYRMLYSQGVPMESLGIPGIDGRGNDTDPRDAWRTLRPPLPPVPRYAVRDVARPGVRRCLRARAPLVGGDRGRLLRTHRRVPAAARVPAPGPLRALQHRGADDDRVAARPAAAPRRAAEERLERSCAHRVQARPGRGPRVPRLPRRHRSSWHRSRARTPRPGTATSRLTGAAGISSGAWARRRPTTAIPPHAPPTSRRAKPRTCSGACSTSACRRQDAELFRAQMLTEMARMSLDDGLVMQIHPGSFRNHNAAICTSLRP